MDTRIPLWSLLIAVLGNAIYFVLTTLIANATLDYHVVGWIITLSVLAVAASEARRTRSLLKTAGIRAVHPVAKDTIDKGLAEAERSYRWLGTSGWFVVVSPELRSEWAQKPTVDRTFITLDPDCDAAIKEQASWEEQEPSAIKNRITETKKSIEQLRSTGVKVAWRGHVLPSVFRIVVPDDRGVYVSAYERGRQGPDCPQLELEPTGILGRWFLDYFERISEVTDLHRGPAQSADHFSSELGIQRIYPDRERRDHHDDAVSAIDKDLQYLKRGEVLLVGVSLRVFFNPLGPFYESINESFRTKPSQVTFRALLIHPESPEAINRSVVESGSPESGNIFSDIDSTVRQVSNLRRRGAPIHLNYYRQAPYFTAVIFPERCYIAPNLLSADVPVGLPMIVFK